MLRQSDQNLMEQLRLVRMGLAQALLFGQKPAGQTHRLRLVFRKDLQDHLTQDLKSGRNLKSCPLAARRKRY